MSPGSKQAIILVRSVDLAFGLKVKYLPYSSIFITGYVISQERVVLIEYIYTARYFNSIVDIQNYCFRLSCNQSKFPAHHDLQFVRLLRIFPSCQFPFFCTLFSSCVLGFQNKIHEHSRIS